MILKKERKELCPEDEKAQQRNTKAFEKLHKEKEKWATLHKESGGIH